MQFKQCKRCHTNYGPHLNDCPHCGHTKFKMRNIDFVPRLNGFIRIWKKLFNFFHTKKEVRPMR